MGIVLTLKNLILHPQKNCYYPLVLIINNHNLPQLH